MYEIDDITNKIICGDALTELRKFPDECVNCVITSPPYWGLRDYGVSGQLGLEKTFDEFLKKILEITAELKRVLKPTGQFWLNFGDVYGTHDGGSNKTGHNFHKAEVSAKEGIGTLNIKSKSTQKYEKSLLMMPERIAIAMCDQQKWILRNKIIWAKQVLLKKENKTKGSVMPTSVKDRFNQSYEDLYFFTKSKKYYSDLDAVRMPNQVCGITDLRPDGILRQRMYPESKYNKFNYRVRDAERKSGQPQFKASEEEINRYGKGSEFEQKYGEPWDRFGENTKKAGNKVNDPRGNHEGGPGSWRDNLDDQEFRKRWKGQKEKGLPATYIGPTGEDHNLLNNPLGKNLPSVWQIGSEPHNFSKELGLKDIDHFAIFPQALVEIPIKFGCPPGGLVLDCFMGSGTTAVVARKLGRNYLGIELSPDYIKIAEKRLSQEILL